MTGKQIYLYPSILPDSLSPSQLSTWQDCEVKWDFAYQKRLKPHGPDWLHFAKGSYIHELLHYYYEMVRSGYEIGDPILVKTMQYRIQSDLQARTAELKEGEKIDYEFFADVSRIVINYVEHRSPAIDRAINQIQIEQHLTHTYDNREFHGYADLIYWDSVRKVWVIRDHKSGTRNTFSPDNVFRNGQLLMYGTIYWIMTGIVAEVEINFVHSKPPKSANSTTKLFDTVRVAHTEETYKNFWEYIMECHERQKNGKPLRNLFACGNCAYFPICNAELRGFSSDVIVRSMYVKSDQAIQPEHTSQGSKAAKTLTVNFGGGND